MKLVTWNVNSLKVRMPRVLELLEQHEPDVVCLQETKTAPRRSRPTSSADAGYHAVHHSAGRWAGVAMLARSDLAIDDRPGLPGEAAARRGALDRGDGRRPAGLQRLRRPTGARSTRRRSTRSSRSWTRSAIASPRCARPGPSSSSPATSTSAPSDLDVYDPAAFAGATHVTPDERGRVQALAGRGGLRRRLPPPAPRASVQLHLVGLPPGPLPPRSGPADRPRAAQRRPGRHAGVLRDRARLPQGHQAVGPRAAGRRAA